MKKIIFVLLSVILVFVIGCTENGQIEKQSYTPKQEPLEGQGIAEQSLPQPPEPNRLPIEDEAVEEKEAEKTQTSWPTFHGDNARTGFSASGAPSRPDVLWKWTFDDFMKIGYDGNFEGNWPIIDDGRVFIAPEDIFALELKTGKKVWAYSGEGDFFPRGLAAGNGKLFISANAGDNLKNLPPGYVYALNENTGKFLWKYQTQKGVSHSLPLFADNWVFIGDDSGSIYALDADNGNLIWKKYLEDAEVIHSSPAYSNGRIFVGTEGSAKSNAMPSYLYALDAKTGKELWRFKVDYIPGKLNLIHSTPAVLDGVVYIGSENGYFYALNAEDGRLIWKNKIASGTEELIGTSAAAALGYGRVFIGTYEGKFLALDQKDGKVIWEYSFGKANADSSPVLADNKVYFGAGEGGNGYFYSFSAGNGNVIWKEKIGGSSGALADGILIVHNQLAEDNPNPSTPVIIAFSDDGKELLWQ